MKIVDVKIDVDRNEMSLLVMFGWGGGYTTNRIWHCSSIADAMTATISEVHEDRAMIPRFARQEIMFRRGFLRPDDAEYAHAAGSAQAIIADIAATLGIEKDDLKIKSLAKKDVISLAEACEILRKAATRSISRATRSISRRIAAGH